ncbi:MAG: triose-phosphate isomerase [Candidatus Aenigmatarchaeota archaeon]|nr:MAG: triose-phosphate isomerase [Candidatus Aenigmarchaeota archaeon]
MGNYLLINFKTYKEGTGKNGFKIGKIAEKLSKKTNVNIILCVQSADIRLFSSLSLPVYSQHIDPITYGANTGWILPEAIKEAGAKGTLLNHSEHQIDYKTLSLSVKRAKETGLKTVVCIDKPGKAKKTAKLNPDFIAIEPPELIGGNISVSKAKPEIITKTINNVNSVKKIPVLIGAGIKNREDVKKGIKLGAKGVLIASGVVKASDLEKAIKNILEGFNV